MTTHSRKGHAKSKPRRNSTADGGVYIGIAMIGVFGIWVWMVAAPGASSWKHGLLGYVIAVLVLINLYSWRVYLGKHLAGWQQSLARLILRWAGYGTPTGRPLAAAHGSARAKMVLLVGLSTSALIVAGLSWVLYGM